MEKELLNYFKCMVIGNDKTKALNFDYMTKGVVLNFTPSSSQAVVIQEFIRDNRVKTLFSIKEVSELSINQLFMKQIAHYFVSYISNFEFDIRKNNDVNSDSVTITFIRGVTLVELQELIDDSLYSNRPVKDSQILAEIIRYYKLAYRVNDIKNNELRVLLFNADKDVFASGDDAVRYIVNKCSDSDLLIKSKEVISSVQSNAGNISHLFLANHVPQLAQVYNRHKRILMALKVGSKSRAHVKTVINKIARHSKTKHKPIVMPKSKTFIKDALKDAGLYDYKNLETFSLRDKFKILNLLDFKLQGLTSDVFVIRNGKTHYEENRPVYRKDKIEIAIQKILESIKGDLKHLEGKTICLPKNIDYGLPVSRKQTVGHLPFGTRIDTDALELSSGIYWRDEWGARDLDLSCITMDGSRIGWGAYLGYSRGDSGIQFSGDEVQARDGAMEFMTSSNKSYGLFLNIFSGSVPSKAEVLVGERSNSNWIDKTFIREEISLKSKGNLIGFVDGKTFKVFYGRIGGSNISSSKDRVLFQKGQSMNWTVKKVLDKAGISYNNDRNADYDLSYEGFTIDKLEKLFEI